MNYTMAAIPTTYSNVTFRSRLEAKWARFFDLCGWSWTYEPYDLDGWIPDFILEIKNPVLVEVKPYTSPIELIAEMEPKSRLTRLDLLGVGSTLLPDQFMGATAFGFGVHLVAHPSAVVEALNLAEDERHGTGFAQLITCPVCGMTTFFNSTYRQSCALSGCGLAGLDLKPSSAEVDRLFKMAGNDTQWKKLKAAPRAYKFSSYGLNVLDGGK